MLKKDDSFLDCLMMECQLTEPESHRPGHESAPPYFGLADKPVDAVLFGTDEAEEDSLTSYCTVGPKSLNPVYLLYCL